MIEFEKAVKTAEKYIHDYIEAEEARTKTYSIILFDRSNTDGERVVVTDADDDWYLSYTVRNESIDGTVTEVFTPHYVQDRTCYRLKLYENDTDDNIGLFHTAMDDAFLFDDLTHQLAYELEQGYTIAPIFREFIAEILRGYIKRPRQKKQKNYVYKLALHFAIQEVMLKHGSKLTDHYLLNAVAQAAENLGYTCSPKTIRRETYYPMRCDHHGGVNPDQFK